MFHANYLSILVAAAAAWIFGAVYYTVFGDAWLMAQGKKKTGLKTENAGLSAAAKIFPFVLSFVAEIVMAWALYGILTHMNFFTLRQGAIAGALLWFGFILTTIAVNNAYTFRSLKLTAIDLAHWLGVMLLIGAIIGAWGV